MDINIVAGKTSELNNEYIFSILKNRDKSKKHIIIAPDRSLFSLEQRLFEETGEGCFFDINVIEKHISGSLYAIFPFTFFIFDIIIIFFLRNII